MGHVEVHDGKLPFPFNTKLGVTLHKVAEGASTTAEKGCVAERRRHHSAGLCKVADSAVK